MAAPVRDFKGQIVAALNVQVPSRREVKKAADELSDLLGWSSD